MRLFSDLYLYSSQYIFGLPNISDSTRLVPGDARSCPVDTPLSCSSNDKSLFNADSCCLNAPGGQFAQTQFWNSDKIKGPPGYLGPTDSWTIHGLWPDHCDGRYDSVCDCDRSGDCSSRNRKCRNTSCNRDYSDIAELMRRFDQQDLLEYINKYWKGIESDENLHQHEWSKHGTCINTLQPSCYDNYVPSQEVVDYFRVAVDLFKGLPTYQWLAEAGIVPSHEHSYSRDEILAALKRARGVTAVIGCKRTYGNMAAANTRSSSGSGSSKSSSSSGKAGGSRAELREVWYMFRVRGSLQTGQFEASEPDFSGNYGGKPGAYCPEEMWYLPKDEE